MNGTKFLGLVCAMALALSGCIPLERRSDGCDATFKQGSKWNIKGLEIPINSTFIGTIKIGEVDYTRPQTEKISETILILDQARLGNCSLITSTNFYLLSVNTRDSIFLKASAGYAAIIEFGTSLKVAKTPAEGLDADRKAAEKIPVVKPPLQLPPEPVGGGPVTPRGAFDNEARQAVIKVEESVTSLRVEVAQLSKELDQVRKTGAQRISVQGFELNGAALLAEQRTVVLAEVRKALAAVPSSRTPNVLLIGYADGNGAQTYNADLALRRAASVAEFLRRHDFDRNFHTEVTSGGVFSQGDGKAARRVDILVSHLQIASAMT